MPKIPELFSLGPKPLLERDKRGPSELHGFSDQGTPQVPFKRALMVINSGYLGYNRV